MRAIYIDEPRRLQQAEYEAIRRDFAQRLPNQFRVAPASDEAYTRAVATLRRCLTPEQLQEYEANGSFHVTARRRGLQLRGKRLLITSREVYNVVDEDEGVAYCAVPEGYLPPPDRMLAQKLMLENDPEAFFRVANRNHHAVGVELSIQTLEQALRAERISAREQEIARARAQMEAVAAQRAIRSVPAPDIGQFFREARGHDFRP